MVVNEHEARLLADELAGFEGLLVLIRGSAGAALLRNGQIRCEASPPPVGVVDTVGAGDALVAMLAVGLTAGLDEEAALRRAVAAGALATTRTGAPAVDAVGERGNELMAE